MRMYDIIMKKRNGRKLSKEEIDFFVDGFQNGTIPDYQVSALMMAIYFNKMDKEETLNLTMAMMHSGEVLDLSHIPGIKADKHSTGGVGDKTSLSLIPIVTSCGLKVAKMSGRGLGHTGGTIDKLESFPGFSTDISTEEFERNIENVGFSIMGQTKDLAPADKKLYALRDVTATVDNVSLIASSIMSKKLAAGADAIVLDVKTGSGAFMKTLEDSESLAREMVDIGNNAGRKTIAVISDMDEPLGLAVGNALEVKEAIETLKGNGPADFTELVYTLAEKMLIAGGICDTEEKAKEKIKEAISSGKALKKLAEFVKAQGGDERYVFNTELLPKAEIIEEVKAPKAGYIEKIICDEVGICSMILGGGRERKEDIIDLSVGIVFKHKTGEYVNKGDVVLEIHANDRNKLKTAKERLIKAISYSDEKVPKKIIIKKVIY